MCDFVDVWCGCECECGCGGCVRVCVLVSVCVVWMGVDDGWLLPLVSALSLFPAAAVLPFCVTHSPRESESERE